MEGISGVAARMAHIEIRMASLAGTVATRPTGAAATPAGSGATTAAGAFASVYADAVAASGARGGVGTLAHGGAFMPGATGALASGGPGGLGGPTIASGRLTAAGVPADLAPYGNGRAPASALRSVGDTGHKLWAPAATSLESLLAAARRDGVKIGITDSYRSYEEQVDLVRRKGLYSKGGLAAAPGTSDHGWGRSLDLDLDSKALAWMRTNGAKFGFAENVPREPWHWTFTPKS